MTRRPHHASAWGPVGSLFAALCCLGVAPVLAALGAVGLGFVVNDLILVPLLVLFLGVTLWALQRDRPRHGHAGPVRLAAAGALATVGGLWVSALVVGAGLVLLMSGSVWNLIRLRST